MKELETQFIHAFSRSPSERVQLAVRKYRGEFYVDLRVWFQTKDNPTYRPTKKGLSFNLSYLPELNQGIRRLLAIRGKLDQNEGIQRQ